MRNPFDGYQTYLLAVLIMVAGVLFRFELLDGDTFVSVITLLTGGAFASTRWAIQKTDKKLYLNDFEEE